MTYCQLKDSLMNSEVFALQLDESTDIQGKAQLLANIQYSLLKTIAYKNIETYETRSLCVNVIVK